MLWMLFLNCGKKRHREKLFKKYGHLPKEGLEEISKDSQGSEKGSENKEDKSRKVIID